MSLYVPAIYIMTLCLFVCLVDITHVACSLILSMPCLMPRHIDPRNVPNCDIGIICDKYVYLGGTYLLDDVGPFDKFQ